MSTAATLPQARASSPHVQGDQPDVLGCILDPAVNLCLWQRPPQAAITDELTALQSSRFPDRRHPTTRATFKDDMAALLHGQALNPADFKHLLADLCTLADYFFSVSGDLDVRFRFATIDNDDCRRFHVDTRVFRLLCTYCGPGTEWLADTQVDRCALAHGAPNEAVVRSGEPSQFEPFWVGIMRGDPNRKGSGLVHRSPPVLGTGQTRVVFCLDADPLHSVPRAPGLTTP